MRARDPRLTEPQQVLLDRLKDGPLIFNGRARSRIEKLQALGLVTADWDLIIGADHRGRFRITVTKTAAGDAVIRRSA